MLYSVKSCLSSIEDVIQDLKDKKMVCVVDDENRENEGDLIFPAEFITPEIVNFMSREARGLICVALDNSFIQRLNLPQMVPDTLNSSPNKTAFTVSVEAAKGVSTGISSADRSRTIQILADENSKSSDLIQPGHVFPIKAQKGGVLKRAGHTEASVDLCRLAGLKPAAVICEIVNPDGTMARLPELQKFTKKHNIRLSSIEDLIHYRLKNESYIQKQKSFEFPTSYGKGFYVHTFWDPIEQTQHLAFVKGTIKPDRPTLVRMHAECITGDVFSDSLTDSSYYLKKSFEKIQENGKGIFVYIRIPQEPSRSLNWVAQKTKNLTMDKKKIMEQELKF